MKHFTTTNGDMFGIDESDVSGYSVVGVSSGEVEVTLQFLVPGSSRNETREQSYIVSKEIAAEISEWVKSLDGGSRRPF